MKQVSMFIIFALVMTLFSAVTFAQELAADDLKEVRVMIVKDWPASVVGIAWGYAIPKGTEVTALCGEQEFTNVSGITNPPEDATGEESPGWTEIPVPQDCNEAMLKIDGKIYGPVPAIVDRLVPRGGYVLILKTNEVLTVEDFLAIEDGGLKKSEYLANKQE